MWIRGRDASRTASAARSMSAACARARAGDDRALDLAGDRPHGLEVADRGDREARLDDVDAQAGELVCDLELLGAVQRDARRLLTVAQRGVEDDDPVVVHVACSFSACGTCSFVLGLRLRGRHALFPPKGEEKEKVKPARHAPRRLPQRSSSNQTRVLPRSTPQRSATASTSRRPCPPGAGSSSSRISGSGPRPRSWTVNRVRAPVGSDDELDRLVLRAVLHGVGHELGDEQHRVIHAVIGQVAHADPRFAGCLRRSLEKKYGLSHVCPERIPRTSPLDIRVFPAFSDMTSEVHAYVRAALPPPPARVLEVGAGAGELAAELRSAGYDVVAIDPAGGPGIVQVPLHELAEPDGSFDAAVAVVSLHHVEPLDASAERLAALLGPGARLVIDEFDVARYDERRRDLVARPLRPPPRSRRAGRRAAPPPALARGDHRRARAVVRRRRAGPRRLPVPLGHRPGPARRGGERDRRRPHRRDRRAAHRDTCIPSARGAAATARVSGSGRRPA